MDPKVIFRPGFFNMVVYSLKTKKKKITYLVDKYKVNFKHMCSCALLRRRVFIYHFLRLPKGSIT